MSALKNLVTDETIANESDSLGSGGILNSGLYNAKITMAYVTTAASGATGLVLQAKTDQGKDIKQTLWMTAGTAKGGNNYYLDKEGKKQYLKGFMDASSLALLTVGKEISELDTEQKVVGVYNFEAKAEVPTKVDVVTELLGKEIIIGLIRQTVDKTKKNDAGVYAPTGETREENEIDKLFRAADRMTTAEIRAAANDPVFINNWAEKWTDKVKDRTSKTAGTAGAPKGAFGAPAATAKPKTSLFA